MGTDSVTLTEGVQVEALNTMFSVYGEFFDTGHLQAGAGSLSFCDVSRVLVVFRWFPASFPSLPALFQGLCSCGGVSVDRNLLA